MKTADTKDKQARRRDAFFEHMRTSAKQATVPEEGGLLIVEAIAAIRQATQVQKEGEAGS